MLFTAIESHPGSPLEFMSSARTTEPVLLTIRSVLRSKVLEAILEGSGGKGVFWINTGGTAFELSPPNVEHPNRRMENNDSCRILGADIKSPFFSPDITPTLLKELNECK